jgi:hypothetical protein
VEVWGDGIGMTVARMGASWTGKNQPFCRGLRGMGGRR